MSTDIEGGGIQVVCVSIQLLRAPPQIFGISALSPRNVQNTIYLFLSYLILTVSCQESIAGNTTGKKNKK